METVGMEIRKGFKLFEMRDDQKLFPLFIGKNTETPMGEWVMAEIVEKHNGFAHRPGWHIGFNMETFEDRKITLKLMKQYFPELR